MYSAGVILYTMLAGTLPFGQNFKQCARFQMFKKWVEEMRLEDSKTRIDNLEIYPDWFLTTNVSLKAKQLLFSLLDPDPNLRASIFLAANHPWIVEAPFDESSPVVIDQEGNEEDNMSYFWNSSMSGVNESKNTEVAEMKV